MKIQKEFFDQRRGIDLLYCIAPSLDLNELRKNINSPHYRSFLRKIKGKTRKFDAPSKELKKIQRKILFDVLYPFSVSKAAQAAIPKLSVVTNAKAHLKGQSFFKLDFKDTFPSVNFQTVVDCLRYLFQAYYSEKERYSFSLHDYKILARTVARLTTYNNALPQGAPTSSFLLNLLLFRMDEELMHLAVENELTYTRYTDDMVFSSRKQQIPLEIRKKIIDVIKKYSSLKFNREKVFYRTGKATLPKITGVLLFKKEGHKSRLLLSREMIEKYRVMIQKATYDEEISKNQIIGIVGWVAMVNGGRIPSRLKRNFEKFFLTRYPEEFDQFKEKFF